MDQFGVLTASYGLKPQGKSAPMASAKQATNFGGSQTENFGISPSLHSKSAQYGSKSPQHSAFVYGSFLDDHNGVFGSAGNKKTQHFGGLDDGIDIFGGPNRPASQSNADDGDPFGIFTGSTNSASTPSASNYYVEDILSGTPDLKSSVPAKTDHGFSAFPSPPEQDVPIVDFLDKIDSLQSKSENSNTKGYEGLAKSVPESDDLIPGFGGSNMTNNSKAPTEMNKPGKQTFTSVDDLFLVLETTSTSKSSGSFLDPLEQTSKLNNSGGTRGSSNTPSLRPPPKPTNGLNINKDNSSGILSIDELEEFAMGQVRNNSRAHIHASEIKQNPVAKTNKSKGATDSGKENQLKTMNDLEFFFSTGSRSTSAPKSRASTLDQTFDGQMQNKRRSEVPQTVPSGSSASMKKSSVTTSLDDLSLIFDTSLSSEFKEVDGETEERRKARLGRHQRTQERAAKAVADMKQRNLQTTIEQEERHRIAETLDVQIKQWAGGKEGNLRALLSTLQHVLWLECGWQQVPLTEMITSASVKKVYRKATLCVHPDKVQQKGASLEQKYIAEKVFDILKEAWNKFNAEELS